MNVTRIDAVIPAFNAALATLETVGTLSALPLPPGCSLRIIVVDDASTDGSAEILKQRLHDAAVLIVAPRNLGRAGAINLGAQAAEAEALLILDCDCWPASEDFLQQHLRTLDEGFDASLGDVDGRGSGFWARYQRAAAQRRARHATRGHATSLTTANMMIRAAAFRAVGGFDARYRHYGFEDRDFLARSVERGIQLAYCPGARVSHDADLETAAIWAKMKASGRLSAPLFRARHPQVYARLGYAAIDAKVHPARSRLLLPLARLVTRRATAYDSFLRRDSVPYLIRALAVRISSAAAYMEGTADNVEPS